MLEAMPSNTEANIAPLLGLLLVRKVGNINPISFFFQNYMGCIVIIFYLPSVKFHIWHNFQAMSHKFLKITVIAGQITTFRVKVNCCKS